MRLSQLVCKSGELLLKISGAWIRRFAGPELSRSPHLCRPLASTPSPHCRPPRLRHVMVAIRSSTREGPDSGREERVLSQKAVPYMFSERYGDGQLDTIARISDLAKSDRRDQ